MRNLFTPAPMASMLPLISVLAMASAVFADPAVLIQADDDTVLKVEYLGSSTDDDPI